MTEQRRSLRRRRSEDPSNAPEGLGGVVRGGIHFTIVASLPLLAFLAVSDSFVPFGLFGIEWAFTWILVWLMVAFPFLAVLATMVHRISERRWVFYSSALLTGALAMLGLALA